MSSDADSAASFAAANHEASERLAELTSNLAALNAGFALAAVYGGRSVERRLRGDLEGLLEQARERDAAHRLLEKVVGAWGDLPEGHHSTPVIGRWLVDTMAPAISSAREYLAQARASGLAAGTGTTEQQTQPREAQ